MLNGQAADTNTALKLAQGCEKILLCVYKKKNILSFHIFSA